ncbi:hypothetical protein LVY72_07215 [Arthrobacter sp. I2-34]|uniref:Uncharacterized protein n=1 Tax=Arthrobacter hankyongi TaxID=2904801 RepID=A0ABS9L4V1_9MICC|nr:hypothetical protein [Arthrobacter hankyongi]MCG2621705.1 hypothetical protein [Arthrobacter hankyongi]
MMLLRRPAAVLSVTGLALVLAGIVLCLTSPPHDFALFAGAPFSPLDLLSGQQKAGLAVSGFGLLTLALGAGTALGLRLARRGP